MNYKEKRLIKISSVAIIFIIFFISSKNFSSEEATLHTSKDCYKSGIAQLIDDATKEKKEISPVDKLLNLLSSEEDKQNLLQIKKYILNNHKYSNLSEGDFGEKFMNDIATYFLKMRGEKGSISSKRLADFNLFLKDFSKIDHRLGDRFYLLRKTLGNQQVIKYFENFSRQDIEKAKNIIPKLPLAFRLLRNHKRLHSFITAIDKMPVSTQLFIFEKLIVHKENLAQKYGLKTFEDIISPILNDSLATKKLSKENAKILYDELNTEKTFQISLRDGHFSVDKTEFDKFYEKLKKRTNIVGRIVAKRKEKKLQKQATQHGTSLSQVNESKFKPLLGRKPGPIEQNLSSAKITNSEFVGTGSSGAEILSLTDGTQLVTKDQRKLTSGKILQDSPYHRFNNIAGEVLTYELDQLFGFNLTPITISRKFDGVPKSAQHFKKSIQLERKKTKEGLYYYQHALEAETAFKKAHPKLWKEKVIPALKKQSFLDYIILNNDRREGNYLISPKGELISIDHGATFTGDRPHVFKREVLKSIKSVENFIATQEGKEIVKKIKKALNTPQFLPQIEAYLGQEDAKFLIKRLYDIVAYDEKKIPLPNIWEMSIDL